MINSTVLIGIAGGSASGKSTLASRLVAALAAARAGTVAVEFSMDRYVHQDKTRGPVFYSESAQAEMFNWNHPDAVDMGRLMVDIQACAISTNAPAVIVVEGLMALQSEALRQILDIRLFVDLADDIRALRRMVRNLKRDQTAEFIADYYRECARVGHAEYVEPSRQYADLIVRGDSDFDHIAPMIAVVAAQRIAEFQRT